MLLVGKLAESQASMNIVSSSTRVTPGRRREQCWGADSEFSGELPEVAYFGVVDLQRELPGSRLLVGIAAPGPHIY